MSSIKLLSLEVEFANPEALPIPNTVMHKAVFKTRVSVLFFRKSDIYMKSYQINLLRKTGRK